MDEVTERLLTKILEDQRRQLELLSEFEPSGEIREDLERVRSSIDSQIELIENILSEPESGPSGDLE